MGLLELLKEAYTDVAPIVATGQSFLHYKIPGDADVSILQSEATNLTKQSATLKGYMNQLLKSGGASVKAQQDDLRAQASAIYANAQDAIKMLQAAVAGIKQIQADTAKGQNVSINDTSQIGSLRSQAESLYQNSMEEISSAINTIKSFFQNTVVVPSQVTAKQVMQTVGGVTSDAAKMGATAAQSFGNATIAAANNVPAAVANTGTLVRYLPWIIGGTLFVGGALYIMNLPKAKSGFSFGD